MSQSSAMHGITANWKSLTFSEENRLTLPGCQYEIMFFLILFLIVRGEASPELYQTAVSTVYLILSISVENGPPKPW